MGIIQINHGWTRMVTDKKIAQTGEALERANLETL